MNGDLRDKARSALRKIEELSLQIPGFAGYKEREIRREADKLLRMKLARDYEKQLRRLSGLQLELTNRGRLAPLITLERAVMKLQLLIDRIKTASYGYSGFFDAVKIKEEQLDALYDFDSELAEGVTRISTLLDQLASTIEAEESTAQQAGNLVALLDELNNTWSRRQDVVLEIEA